MTTLLYRGHAYTQNTSGNQKPLVQLTYRRHTYQSRQAEAQAHVPQVQLTYRGVRYSR
tara:strand:+ start:178 stop:351 length:174 start_codon:yes stop_codon:yes gene_type:complete